MSSVVLHRRRGLDLLLHLFRAWWQSYRLLRKRGVKPWVAARVAYLLTTCTVQIGDLAPQSFDWVRHLRSLSDDV